jgi:hypothetical protein
LNDKYNKNEGTDFPDTLFSFFEYGRIRPVTG